MKPTPKKPKIVIAQVEASGALATCRHIVYNLTRKAPGKDSIRNRRKTAGWDDEYLASLIAPDRLHPIPLPTQSGITSPI